MSVYQASMSFRRPSGLGGTLKTLTKEVVGFLDAMLYPGKIIAEVEQMAALRRQADRIQTTDPTLAASLRRRASLIGLR